MDLLIDTHTHTVLSGHAYSTIFENVILAAEKGLQGIVVTEHCDHMPNVRFPSTIAYQRQLPEEYRGVRIFRGIETNIMQYDGTVDMTGRFFPITQFAIASLHGVVIEPGTRVQNTDALLGALHNPYIDSIGHPGNPVFEIDQETVVREAYRLGKLLEVNNRSFMAREGSEENCSHIIRLCKKYGVRICVGSDAHLCFEVGEFGRAVELLKEEAFPEELIVNRDMDTFLGYLSERKARIRA